MRLTLCVVLLSLAAVAGQAADGDLAGRRQEFRGDLSVDEVDRVGFVAPVGTRVDVRIEVEAGLAPEIRVVGPEGVVDSAARLRVKAEGRKLRLKWLTLDATGSFRIELIGRQTGEYEGRIKLDIPSKVKSDLAVTGGMGGPSLTTALPPGARWKKIRVKPGEGSAEVDVLSLIAPDGSETPYSRGDRSRGFEVIPAADAAPGVYVLHLRRLGGLGSVRIRAKYRDLSITDDLLDLRDGMTAENGPPPTGPDAATTGEVLVRLARGMRMERFLEDHDDLVLSPIAGTGYHRALIVGADSEEQALEDLLADSAVLHAERNVLTRAPEGGQSSIPVLDDNLDEEEARTQPGLDRIGVLAAQAHSLGAGVVVAVIDTGVDLDHPFLAGRIAPGGQDLVDGDTDPREERNGQDDDGDGQVDEGYGHGTFVAGLVLAVAPEARILPFRVLDSDAGGESASVAEAVVLAVDSGAHVVNLSLGSTYPARIVLEAIRFARERGVLVVVAAGNDADEIQFPARYGHALAVTAVDADGLAADFTNLGIAADLAAPGVDMIGPMPLDLGIPWARWSGTSFAAPLVSGVAALMRAIPPHLSGEAAALRLKETAEDIGAINPDVGELLGEGLVRADRAVDPE